MKLSIFNRIDPLSSFILDAITATGKALDILNTYITPNNLLGKLPYNLYHKLPDKLINSAEPDESSKSDSDAEELEGMLKQLWDLYERLQEFLRDTSEAGKAKLRALYEYILDLFEKLKKMDVDWTNFELSDLALWIMAFIVGALVSALCLHTFLTCRHAELLRADRHRRWERAREHTRRHFEHQEKELRRAEWKLNPLNPARELNLRPGRLTSEEIKALQEIRTQAGKLRHKLKKYYVKL